MPNINFIPFPELSTERLTLRQLKVGDSRDIFELRSDPRVNKYLERKPAENMEEVSDFITEINARINGNEQLYWAITLGPVNEFAGTICNASNEITALMIFSIRDGVLKLPYIYHDDCLSDVIKVIHQHIVKWRIKTFTTYHNELAYQLRKAKSPAVFKKEVERLYLVSFELKEMLSSKPFVLQDGDGDCVFT